MSNNYHVLWTDTAVADLNSIIDYIAEDSPTAAIQVMEKLQESGSKIKTSPERGRYVPELRNFNIYIYRELIIKPWRLIYRYDSENVYILALLDSRRDLDNLLIERLIK